MHKTKQKLKELSKLNIEITREENNGKISYFNKDVDVILYSDKERKSVQKTIKNILMYSLIRDKVFLYVKEINKIPTLIKITSKNQTTSEKKIFEFTDSEKLRRRNSEYIKHLLIPPGFARCSESFDSLEFYDRLESDKQFYYFEDKFKNENMLDLYCENHDIILNKKKIDILPKNYTNMYYIESDDMRLKIMMSLIFKGDTRKFSIDGIPIGEIVPFLLFDEFTQTQKYLLYESEYAESAIYTIEEMKKHLTIKTNKELMSYIYINYGWGFSSGGGQYDRVIGDMAFSLGLKAKIEFLGIGDPTNPKTFERNPASVISPEWEDLVGKYEIEYNKIKNEIKDNNPTWRSEYYLYVLTESEFPDAVFQHKVCINNIYYYYDIFIPSINTIIEYHGEQHYEPVEIFGGEEVFVKVVKNDRIKEEYLEEKAINFIEWKYDIPITRYNFFKMLNVS